MIAFRSERRILTLDLSRVQQEMDALYGPFKSALYACGKMIIIEKIKNRGMLRSTPAAQGASSILSLGFHDVATIMSVK